ncbi:flagellar motor control protein ZomB [Nocardia yamanashiensis]|uniref:flagellar motor control protein ZomB n=1 Tax=Nocardia yamanashiensis TaxID=209247 RepID=UPI000B083A8B|nr:flagellar motor control protein ZomB [Nocardia yamanashiensis]
MARVGLSLLPALAADEEVAPRTVAHRPYRIGLIGGIAAAAILFTFGGWERRWIADDGLTVLRTVRNLLAGNGPVFNAGERVEVNTSTAWTYLIWFGSWVTRARLEYVAVGSGLILSVVAIVAAMLGTARLWGGARAGLLLPAGVLVYIALPPARDYVTSGLESSLVVCWLAVLWRGLITWSRSEKPGMTSSLALAFLAGLAPLVRPELVLVGAPAVFMICCAPLPESRSRPWLFRVATVVAAGLVPVSYQIWRMGYYGLPYPNTAVAKDVSGSKWRQGLVYLWNFVGPYWLWVPLVILGVAALFALRSWLSDVVSLIFADVKPTAREVIRGIRTWLRTPSAVVTLMLGAGLLLTLYELRVGGDFMHGRMLLPPLFCLLLPVMVLPLKAIAEHQNSRHGRLAAAGAFSAIAGWALLAADVTAIETPNAITPSGIADERLYYARSTGHPHPIRAEDYLDYPRIRPMLREVARHPDGGLLINTPSFQDWRTVPPHNPDATAPNTVFYMNLGMISMNLPLEVRVLDPMGLAYPLAAHTFRFPDARIGHDKNLDSDWAVVDAGMATEHPRLPWYLDEGWTTRIRTALSCPETRDLLASTRAPLTFDRFRRNIHRSLSYAGYRIDRVPEFEIERCRLQPARTAS